MRSVDKTRKIIQEQTLTVLELQAFNEKWAIPALDVTRIIERQPLEDLPQGNVTFNTCVTYDNEKVPFLSLGFYLEGVSSDIGPMIIFDHQSGKLALGLNQLFSLKRIPLSQIIEMPAIFEQKSYRDSIFSCYLDGDDIIPIVNLKTLEF